jgi:hypothetical protein
MKCEIGDSEILSSEKKNLSVREKKNLSVREKKKLSPKKRKCKCLKVFFSVQVAENVKFRISGVRKEIKVDFEKVFEGKVGF